MDNFTMKKCSTNLRLNMNSPKESNNHRISLVYIIIGSKMVSPMEKILKNPGLIHLAEDIFKNLSDEAVEICRYINQSSREILDNINFWLRKFGNLSKDNQKEWKMVIQSVKKSKKEKAIISYLQWNLKKEAMDLPCFSNHDVQDDFRKKIWEICEKKTLSDEDIGIIKILAPLTDNINAVDIHGETLICEAVYNGHTEIVRILAPLADNPNAPNKDISGHTPIYRSALYGRTEMVKILAPLTCTPNAPPKNEITPIYAAACEGHTEIVKFLAPLTDNPNAPDESGWTPMHWIAWHGYTEIFKFLALLTDDPNPPDNIGQTPYIIARVRGSKEIQKFLQTYQTSRKRKTGLSSTKPSKKRAKKF